MKITEHIEQSKNTLISFEVLPPLKGKTITSLFAHLDMLVALNPAFINVTYHRTESVFRPKQDGTFQKIEVRKRPGTVGICAAIQHRYKIDAVPHIICGGFSKNEIEDILIDLNYLGLDNLLALRGDAAKLDGVFKPEPQGHRYGVELLQQIVNLQHGIYLDKDLKTNSPLSFCAGVAGYPEKHFEAPNAEFDLQNLKKKVDTGADYIVTQMFFNNQKYFDFVKKCRAIGITVPIIPGLKPITNQKQLAMLPNIFHVDIPIALSKEILKCKTDEACEQIGEEWLIAQSNELKQFGVPVLHYYTLGKPQVIKNVVHKVM